MRLFRRFLSIIAVATLLAVATGGCGGKTTVESERAKLEGTWQVIREEQRGVPWLHQVGLRFVFDGDTMEVIPPSKDEGAKWQYDLNVEATPKQIDWPSRYEAAGKVVEGKTEGIYRLQGDELFLCYSYFLGDVMPTIRPSEFSTAGDEQAELLVLKRVGDKNVRASAPEAPGLPFEASRAGAAYYALESVISGKSNGKFNVDFRLAQGTSRKVWERGWRNLLALRDIGELCFRGRSGVGDAEMARVSKLISLEKLDLSFADVGDAGIARLTGLENLKHIDLSFTSVTDAGLATLAQFQRLETAVLKGTAVSAQGIRTLRDARPGLKLDSGCEYTRAQQRAAAALGQLGFNVDDRLEEDTEFCRVAVPSTTQLQVGHGGEDVTQHKPPFGYGEVCDASVVRKLLADLPAPTAIDAPGWHTRMESGEKDDTIFYCLQDVRGLARLRLREAPVTDDGLAELQRHKALKDLDLQGAQNITDAGLAHLQKCPSLEKLNVKGTQCTANALVSLVATGHLRELRSDVRQSDHDLVSKCAQKGVNLLHW
jgi:uncharacterized protein (TIGR03067 family)